MARRRKRRPFNWGPLLWVALIANIAAGLWFSSLTAIRRLRIEGAPLSDRGRLVTLAQTLKNQPVVPIDPRAFETVVQKLNATLKEILAMQEIKTRLLELGIEARSETPAELTERLRSDIEKWRAVIEKAGIPKQ